MLLMLVEADFNTKKKTFKGRFHSGEMEWEAKKSCFIVECCSKNN